MKKAVYEIFDEFIRAPNRDAKKEVLQRNATDTLLFVLQGAFHPAIQYVVKEPVPYSPMKNSIPGVAYQGMNDAMKKMYIWVEGSKKVNPNLRHDRKITLLTQLLESMEPREATVLSEMLMKDLQVKNLTYRLVSESFPGLLPNAEPAKEDNQ